MQHNFKLDLKIILLAALIMFAVSILLSFALLFIVGIVQFGLTLNFHNYERHWYGFDSAEETDWEEFRRDYKKAIGGTF